MFWLILGNMISYLLRSSSSLKVWKYGHSTVTHWRSTSITTDDMFAWYFRNYPKTPCELHHLICVWNFKFETLDQIRVNGTQIIASSFNLHLFSSLYRAKRLKVIEPWSCTSKGSSILAGASYLCACTVCIYFIIIKEICPTWLIKKWALWCENSFVWIPAVCVSTIRELLKSIQGNGKLVDNWEIHDGWSKSRFYTFILGHDITAARTGFETLLTFSPFWPSLPEAPLLPGDPCTLTKNKTETNQSQGRHLLIHIHFLLTTSLACCVPT